MRRIYFLVPDLKTASTVTDELLLARIEERHIHVIAREGTELGDLPKASLLQTSDVIPAVERGLAVGGVTGILAGVAAVSFPPAGVVLGGGAILATALAGSGIGAWMAGMIGVDVANSQIKQFEDDIEKGEILFLVDVPKERVEQIEAMVKSHHPDADIEGTEPHIPAFPRSSALRMTKLRRQVSRNQALADQLAPATQRWEFPDLWRTTACQMPAPQC